MDKRGLSAVIISLILILLAIVVSGVLWVVISNVVRTGSEEITLGSFFLDLQIENVKVEDNGDLSVTVKRGAGEGDLVAVNFIVSDGDNSVVVKEPTTLQELGTSTFTIEQAELSGIVLVKEVSVVPVIVKNEKESIGNVGSIETVPAKETLKELGAIAWWKLNGDATDEIGGSDGTIEGELSCGFEGQFGNACNFGDSDPEIITIPANTKFDFTGDYTLVAWIKPTTVSPTDQGIIGKKSVNGWGIGLQFDKLNFGKHSCSNFDGNTVLNVDTWYHAAGVFKTSDSEELFLNGESDGTGSLGSGNCLGDISALVIGRYRDSAALHFNGLIDEVIIFDRALTADEIKALYELDLD